MLKNKIGQMKMDLVLDWQTINDNSNNDNANE